MSASPSGRPVPAAHPLRQGLPTSRNFQRGSQTHTLQVTQCIPAPSRVLEPAALPRARAYILSAGSHPGRDRLCVEPSSASPAEVGRPAMTSQVGVMTGLQAFQGLASSPKTLLQRLRNQWIRCRRLGCVWSLAGEAGFLPSRVYQARPPPGCHQPGLVPASIGSPRSLIILPTPQLGGRGTTTSSQSRHDHKGRYSHRRDAHRPPHHRT